MLEERGIEVHRHPLVKTEVRTDSRTRSAVATLMALPWLLVTSRSTVEALLALGGFEGDPLIGAVGPATATALEEAGAPVTLVANPHDAQGLAHAFLGHPLARGPVGLPCGNRALDLLERQLGEAGFATRPLVVYDTVQTEWQGGAFDALVLASPSAVQALPEAVGDCTRLVTLGKTTSAAARSRGWQCDEAEESTPQATLAALERVLR